MLKKIFFTIILSFLFLPIISANGQDSITATLWTPENMLPNEEYYGVIIVESNVNSDTAFDIITDNEEVINVVTDNVVIEKGKHHGIITLKTKGTGDASLYAIHKDLLLDTQIDVKESAATPTKLDLILPTDLFRVLADDNSNTGYVFLLNEFDDPVAATEPTPITLTSNGDIELIKNLVTIKPDNHYAKFSFMAGGEGDITATGQNLEPDEESINVDDVDEIELHIEVAPDPIPTYSSGEIYFWLERDDQPYIPTHDVKITISIDKPANLSFDPKVRGSVVLSDTVKDKVKEVDSDARYIITKTETELARDSERQYIIEKGSYYGRLTVYASFNEESDIAISGVAESINPPDDEEDIRVTEVLNTNTEQSNFGIATEVSVFALPDPGYKQVEIIVSSENSDGPVIERNDETIQIVTQKELLLDAISAVIKTDQNYVITKAKVLDSGSVEIFAERNEAESDIIEIDLEGKYVKDPDLRIVPFPVIFGTEQDLFLITSSHEKIKIDPSSEEEGNLVSITSRPSFLYEAVREGESVLAVKGIIDNLLEDEPKVVVASNAFTTEEELEVFNPQRNKIESMHPRMVFPKEPFPLVNHITDLDDNAIKKAELKVSSSAKLTMINGLTYLNTTGEHGIIFYDKNSVPIESVIQVGASRSISTAQQIEDREPTITTYEIIVENGQGSGMYDEGTDVTISAEPVIDDMIIIKKNLVGWENLPYTESTVTFEADDNIQTKPIYQTDYSILFAVIGAGAAIGAIFVLKNKIKKRDTSENEEKSEEELAIEEILGK